MKKRKYILIALLTFFSISCGQSTRNTGEENEEHTGMGNHAMHEEMGHEEHQHEDMDHEEHQHGEMKMGDMFTWMPGKETMNMMDKMGKITLDTSSENNILVMKSNDNRAECMLKNKWGNIGLTASIKLDEFNGVIELIHHKKDDANFEFVSISDGMMKLGKTVDGKEEILDSKKIELPQDWFNLTATSAGEHYKGYINEKLLTHGHGEEMEPGVVGIRIIGKGKVLLRKMTVTPLEEVE